MAFWHSLVYSNARLAGLRERRHQDFEAGVPSFPWDFPTSVAYEKLADAEGENRRSYWERCPPAKRPGYAALGTPAPFRVDWNDVLGRPSSPSSSSDPHLVPTATDLNSPAASLQTAATPFLLCGDLLRRLMDLSSSIITKLKDEEPVCVRSALPPLFDGLVSQALGKTSIPVDVSFALARVSLRPIGRGSPQELAVIYGLSDEDRRMLLSGAAEAEANDIVSARQSSHHITVLIPLLSGPVVTGYHWSRHQWQLLTSKGRRRKLCLRSFLGRFRLEHARHSVRRLPHLIIIGF